MPEGFKEWVKEHEEAQANWNSTPYFIKDNFKDGKLSKGLKFEVKPQAGTDAQRDPEAIRQAWNERRIANIRQAIAGGYLPEECAEGLSSLPQERFNERIAFLQKRAAAHAARTPEEIQAIKDAWAKTVKEHECMEKNSRQYEQLKADPDYRDVAFNPESGGLKATHVRHNFDRDTGKYEREVQNIGFNTGHSVILGNEYSGTIGLKHTDGTWDGLQFEIAGRETGTSNNIKRGLEHCADKRDTEIAVLYFPNGDFDIGNFENALRRYNGLERLNDGQFVKFRKIICIQDGKIVHEEEP